jgi:hypothetical protein
MARNDRTQLAVYEPKKQPYSAENFSALACNIIIIAGFPTKLQSHDLRRFGLTEGRDAGATDQ